LHHICSSFVPTCYLTVGLMT